MADILYATNAASSSQILGLLGRAEADDASLATLGAWFANQGYGLGYELGLAELVRLRRIAEREQAGHLDLPAFHARLLCEGRVPARWIAEAWGLPAE
jgi:hypothetical protein